MRRPSLLAMSVLAIGFTAFPLKAQLTDLEDTRTPEQKWARSMYIGNFAWSALVQHGKTMGLTVEETARWMGEYAAPSWGAPNPRTPASYVRGMLMNYSLWDGFAFEILSETESEVRGRMNTPYAPFFGDAGEAYGVTLAEFREFWTGAYETTAGLVGLDMEHRVDGEWIEFTVKTK